MEGESLKIETAGLAELEAAIRSPDKGLPEDIFLFISRVTPLVNVDLLVQNDQNQTLLTWRDDGYYPPGWHVPGGIIRYKETFEERIRAAAKIELGAEVRFDGTPLAINQVVQNEWKNRGHFISLLFKCCLITSLDEGLRCKTEPADTNQWKWHEHCPANIIPVHEMYRSFIDGKLF